MPGKVPPESLLTHVFERTGAPDDAVRLGPATGEDAAAIDWPGGTLVVSSDPLSLAASQVGTLGVHVACNDVAATGADPRWLTVVILLPTDTPDSLEAITADLDAAASDLDVAIVGGHSEYVDALERPLLSLTAMGATERVVPTGGAEPGDSVLLVGAAGLEGTAILAADFGDTLEVDEATIRRAETFFEEISVVPAAAVVREHATAMHDPTEGGVAAALLEVAQASGTRLEVDPDAIPVRPETRRLAQAAGVDPLRMFGSGALLATVPAREEAACLEALEAADLEGTVIGTVRAGDPAVDLGTDRLENPVTDALYPLWERVDAGAEGAE